MDIRLNIAPENYLVMINIKLGLVFTFAILCGGLRVAMESVLLVAMATLWYVEVRVSAREGRGR